MRTSFTSIEPNSFDVKDVNRNASTNNPKRYPQH
jgi:hypothetical protein